MKLWRLVRPDNLSLDGAGAARYGTRYSSPGQPLVSFASEPGLAVLVVLRYLEPTSEALAEPYLLGWTQVEATVERIADHLPGHGVRLAVDEWASSRRSLLVALRSMVLPEADVVLLNPRHAAAAAVPPLACRAFSFAACLHRPPMLDRYRPPGAS